MLLAIKINNIHVVHPNYMAIPDCIQFLSFISNFLMNPHVGDIVMVFNATFNNISDKSWQSVLLEKETGVPGENH